MAWRTQFVICHSAFGSCIVSRRKIFPRAGCFPQYSKTLNLINYITRAEIVKNFTNFACGIGEGPIRFRRSSTGPHLHWHEWLMGSPFFAAKKQLTVRNSSKEFVFALARV